MLLTTSSWTIFLSTLTPHEVGPLITFFCIKNLLSTVTSHEIDANGRGAEGTATEDANNTKAFNSALAPAPRKPSLEVIEALKS